MKASIDPGVMKLTPRESPAGSWEFELQSPPLTAIVTFDILDADALALPDITVNDRALGPATVHQPDLADPAYVGLVRPLDRDMRFRYAGWLRGQKAIPGSALRAGLNKVVLQLNRESGPVAVRAVELQLKHNSPALDYTLSLPRSMKTSLRKNAGFTLLEIMLVVLHHRPAHRHGRSSSSAATSKRRKSSAPRATSSA